MFLIVESDAALLACFATGLKIMNGLESNRALADPSNSYPSSNGAYPDICSATILEGLKTEA